MKNKNTLYKIFSGGFYLTVLVSMMSCDPLGMEPTTMVDQDRFWESPQLTREYVNNFYTWTPVAAGHFFQSEQWSDNCQGNREKDWTSYYQYPFNNRQYDIDTSIDGLDMSSAWNNSYKNIRAINIGIEKISGSTVLTDAIKNQCLAECYFFRAWEYFDMEKYWGTVPYVDKALSTYDETFLPRIKREQLFDNILSDLTKSAQYFTNYGGKPVTGMVNANVVEAFRSRVALYAACAAEASAKGLYNFDDKAGLFTFEKQASKYYEIAYNAARSLIGGKYSLEANYEDLFIKENAHKSPESIWPVMFDKANRSGFNPTEKNGPDGDCYGNSSSITVKWEMRSGLFPTQDLVDCYLQYDETDRKWKNWWETSKAKAMGVVNNNGKIEGQSADYRQIFENRDKRFYATVTHDGAYMGPSEERYSIQTWIDNSQTEGTETSFKYSALHTGYRDVNSLSSTPSGRGSAKTITGYYSRKYSHFDKFNTDGGLNKEQRSTCYFNIRYAEVLLNCAEASIKLNKGDAKTYINDIRKTHGGLDDYSGTDEGLMNELKLQKRLEFAFECPGFRYFDLLRWGESDGLQTIPELDRPSRGLWIFRKGIESKEAGKNGYPVLPGSEGYFTPHFETADMNYDNYKRKFNNARFYFIPFSQTTMSSYTGLIQNPGWTNYKYTN